MVLCVIGVGYASSIAFRQCDAKRLIAYSSIAHVWLIVAGVFAWNVQSLQGAIIQMVNHGISVLGLFFVVDILVRRLGTRRSEERRVGKECVSTCRSRWSPYH